MSTRLRVSVFPRSRPMVVEMSGTKHNIPIVTISDDQYDDAEISITLGNTDDPAKWLRESAAALLNLADQIDATTPAEVSA